MTRTSPIIIIVIALWSILYSDVPPHSIAVTAYVLGESK